MSNNETAARQAAENLTETGQETKNTIFSQTEQTLSKLKEKVSEQAGSIQEKSYIAKEKVSDNLSGAADTVHQKSDQTQEFLTKKTDEINKLAQRTIEKANELGHRAGDALNSSSEYVRNFDIQETRQQVKEKIQQNPGRSLVVAGVFGLLIGLLIGRTNKS